MQGKFISIYITEELRWHVLNTAFKGKVLQIPKAAVIMMAVILYLQFGNFVFNLIFAE